MLLTRGLGSLRQI